MDTSEPTMENLGGTLDQPHNITAIKKLLPIKEKKKFSERVNIFLVNFKLPECHQLMRIHKYI